MIGINPDLKEKATIRRPKFASQFRRVLVAYFRNDI